MSTTIQNQASITYLSNGNSETATSNIATTQIESNLEITITCLESSYQANDYLTYTITVKNIGSTTYTNPVINHNLGTYFYTPVGLISSISVSPLTYIGPSQYYQNGLYLGNIIPVVSANNVQYSLSTIEPNTIINIIAKYQVNDYAELEVGSSITAIASATATNLAEMISDQCTTPVAEYTDVTIIKHMCPNPIVEGADISYFFNLSNSGNIEATNLVLTDTFDPAPPAIGSVTLNGSLLDSSLYSYTAGTLTLPSTATTFTITIPAAVFTQDSTGLVTTIPGTSEIVVVGTGGTII